MGKFKKEYILLDKINRQGHYKQIAQTLRDEGRAADYGAIVKKSDFYVVTCSDGGFRLNGLITNDGEYVFKLPKREIPFVPKVEFKDEHVVLDQDNKEEHYAQIVEVLEAEGRIFFRPMTCTIFDAVRVELYEDGDYAFGNGDCPPTDPEREMPFVPKVKFKREYIIIDSSNKQAHCNQIFKVLEAEGMIAEGDLRERTANGFHFQLYEDGTYQIYNYQPNYRNGVERNIPFKLYSQEEIDRASNDSFVKGLIAGESLKSLMIKDHEEEIEAIKKHCRLKLKALSEAHSTTYGEMMANYDLKIKERDDLIEFTSDWFMSRL